MKKIFIVLGVLVGIIVLVIVGGLVFASTALESIVEEAIEEDGTEVVGTRVSVGDVEISPISGEGTLSDLSIANPEGFSERSYLNVGKIAIEVDPWTVLSQDDTVRIHEIIIDQAEMSFEMKRGEAGRETNVDVLRENIAKMREGESEEEAEQGRKVIVERFLLKNSKLSIHAKILGRAINKSVNVPPLELHDIGEASNGVLAREAAKQIFGAIRDHLRSLVGRTPGRFRGLLEKIRQRREGREGGLLDKVRQRLDERGEGDRGGVLEKARDRREERGDGGGALEKARDRREDRGEGGGVLDKVRQRREERREKRGSFRDRRER